MSRLEVFDPPMCCATGICGSSVDPTLVTFASDLEWLKQQGVEVIRHGLSLEPAEFVKNENVKTILGKEGNGCLPIIIFNNKLVSKSCYPSREKLAEICKVKFNEDEAPPVHREENCCCGVDCDCRVPQSEEQAVIDYKCDCTNAPAEDNCLCQNEDEFITPTTSANFSKTITIIILLIIVMVIVLKILL